MRMVDPPEGWLYGFPKPFTFHAWEGLHDDDYEYELTAWFRKEGYPQKLIDQGMLKHCRYWDEGK